IRQDDDVEYGSGISGELMNFFPAGNIPLTHNAVGKSAGKYRLTIGAEGYRRNPTPKLKDMNLCPAGSVPQTGCAIIAASNQPAPVGRDSAVQEFIGMSDIALDNLAGIQVNQQQVDVVWGFVSVGQHIATIW